MKNQDIYITVTGINNYYGSRPFKPGGIVKFIKEPENRFDSDAIRAEFTCIGRVGYVANSPATVVSGTYSAGRIYDKVGSIFFGRIMFTTRNEAIVMVLSSPEEILGGKFFAKPIFKSEGQL